MSSCYNLKVCSLSVYRGVPICYIFCLRKTKVIPPAHNLIDAIMKTALSLFGLFGLILLMNFGCTGDKDLDFTIYEGNAKLKRTLLYSSADAQSPIKIIDEYEYDNQWRISKVSSPWYDNGNIMGTIKYDLYDYNSSGQLTSISNYNANTNSPSGYINLKNSTYTYSSNGMKEKQYIEYPQINSFEYTLYFYNDNKLVKTEKHNNKNDIEDYSTYEYNGDRLVKETGYSSNGEVNQITNHIYANGLNTKTEIYGGNQIGKVREIIKTYDKKYNLIMIELKELALWSSMMSYVMKYEYY